jgi:hypothetical protein
MMRQEHNQALKPLSDLANLRDDVGAISRFLKAHPDYLGETGFDQLSDDVVCGCVLGLRDKVRELWRGGPRANGIAREFLLEKEIVYGNGDEVRAEISPAAVDVDWARSRLVLKYEALNLFQGSIYNLMQVSRFAKVCGRPDCPTPYFIASKVLQQYCGRECVKWARLESANDYYKRLGAMKRRKRLAKQSKRKRGKRE